MRHLYRHQQNKIMTIYLKDLFDIIVYYSGKTYSIEIKNGLKSKLTTGEQKCKEDIESVGVKYHVVYTLKQAINILEAEIN